MTPLDASKLLTYMATVDNRTFDSATVAVWAKVLQDVDLADAIEAATEHYATSTEYLMPIHVLRLADAIAGARLQLAAAQSLPPIDGLADPRADDPLKPGFLVVRFVTVKLAEQRKASGGPLGAERARELAQDYVDAARKAYNVQPAPADYHTPCQRPNCRCTHTDGCEAGWIEVQPDPEPPKPLFGEESRIANRDVGRVRPCPICRPAVGEIIQHGRNRRAVQATLRTRSPATVVRAPRAKR